MTRRRERDAGLPWRVQGVDGVLSTGPLGAFDEIAVGDPCWLHAEMLDGDSCFVQIADRKLWVHIKADGTAEITNEEDERGQVP